MKLRNYFFLVLLAAVVTLSTTSISSAQNISTVAYLVEPGDTLAKIARKFCTNWQEIHQLNLGIIGSDPDRLEAGTVIYVIPRCGFQPDECPVYDQGPRLHATGHVSGNVYTVNWGDTLYSIGLRFGVSWEDIAANNNASKLEAGQKLIIPGLCSVPPGAVQPYITINSPQPGAVLDGPYIATGNGGGLPEGNVVVRLLDGNNELMAQQATVLQGQNVGTGGSGVWSVQFDNIYGQPQSNGSIEAFSPETGVSSSVSIWFSGR